MLWPLRRPIDPAMVVPMQIGDPRLTTDRWHEVGDEQRAIEQERQRRELEQAEIARKQFYGQGLTWPMPLLPARHSVRWEVRCASLDAQAGGPRSPGRRGPVLRGGRAQRFASLAGRLYFQRSDNLNCLNPNLCTAETS
jgi:hypothetical protein